MALDLAVQVCVVFLELLVHLRVLAPFADDDEAVVNAEKHTLRREPGLPAPAAGHHLLHVLLEFLSNAVPSVAAVRGGVELPVATEGYTKIVVFWRVLLEPGGEFRV